jgi:hypothetical protein
LGYKNLEVIIKMMKTLEEWLPENFREALRYFKNRVENFDLVGKRVPTTEQIAQGYGCEGRQLLQNCNNNMNRFVEEQHYYKTDGHELKEFKASIGSSKLSNNLQFAPSLYRRVALFQT